METKAPAPVWLRLDMALELVEPYRLEDVLSCLQENKVIQRFSIGPGFVKIEPTPGQRFDLAMYFAETTGEERIDRGRKRGEG